MTEFNYGKLLDRLNDCDVEHNNLDILHELNEHVGKITLEYMKAKRIFQAAENNYNKLNEFIEFYLNNEEIKVLEKEIIKTLDKTLEQKLAKNLQKNQNINTIDLFLKPNEKINDNNFDEEMPLALKLDREQRKNTTGKLINKGEVGIIKRSKEIK